MKRLREMRNQLISGLIMLSVSIPLLLVALSAESKTPTLAFRGMTMEMQQDGSVQMLVQVSIENVAASEALPTGAWFQLKFNTEYLTPSQQSDNRALRNGESASLAFQYNPELYKEKDGSGNWVSKNPFEEGQGEENEIIIPPDSSTEEKKCFLNLDLAVDRNIVVDPTKSQGLISVRTSMSHLNAFQTADKILLGTLSFRVEPENLDKLPEITENFGHIVELEDPKGKNEKYLIQNKDLKVTDWQTGSWNIIVAYEVAKGSGIYTLGHLDNSKEAEGYTTNPGSNPFTYKPYAESRFTFEFPRIIIGVDPVEPELTVDAYQAYTTGHISDLDIVLQKYSPAVLVRYSDGSRKNEIFPWGRDSTPWTTSKVTPWEENVDWADTTKTITDDNTNPDYKYDPTGDDYKVQKLYCYTEKVNGVDVQKVFPLPVSAHLTVTPIKLIDITADNLRRTYLLNDALVGSAGVRELSDLALPEEARLVTDVPAGGATLTMPIPGWSHENEVSTGPSDQYWPFSSVVGENPKIRDLQKDGATDSNYHRWPVADDRNIQPGGDAWSALEPGDPNSNLVGDNRAGSYTFQMAQAYGQTPVEGFTRTQIKTAYPWLTVPDNNETANVEIWPLDDALRQIVWNGSAKENKKLVDRERYKVTYQSTTTNYDTRPELLLPDLTLHVEKQNVTTSVTENLPESTRFRIKLPDGTEIGTDLVADDVALEDWFTPAATGDYNGAYIRTRQDVSPVSAPNTVFAFDLTLNPGQTDKGSYAEQRERLLRYINLGGWFSVSVNENPGSETVPAAYYWSDYIPVYVPPRRNVHLEDKIYNFIAGNADLYHFISASRTTPVFPTTITLPAGSYETVNEKGEPEYDTVGGESVRHVERYGVKTLYSGVDGSQFGELNTFSIEPAAWDENPSVPASVNGKAITQYGPNHFKHDARYGVYNWVHNPGIALTNTGTEEAPVYAHDENRMYTATIRTQNDLTIPPDPNDPDALREGITLTYEGPPGGVTDGTDGNVDLVTFNTRLEGYTVRQEYTLVITNVGDIDIHGLAIDMETDLPNIGNYGVKGGNFTLLKPPASFLPAGERTTFTISYVYDLRAADDGNELEYLDKLFITSDNKHSVGPGKVEGKDYLLDFDAQFKVTGNKIHRVLVQYNPADGTMGTAQVIVGDIAGIMNINAGSSAAATGSMVYVMATPTDEYKVQSYSAVDSNGSPVLSLDVWRGTITLADGVTTLNIDENSQIRIWSFEMPDSDVTMTINFYEPISSKLRLSNLKAYASDTETDLYEDGAVKPIDQRRPFEYAVWQKEFTSAELAESKNQHNPANPNPPSEEEQDRYLMQYGKAVKKGYDDKVNQYLVVIPYEADYAQVEATLRKVLYPADGSGNLPKGTSDTVTVDMYWFPEDVDVFTYVLTEDVNHIYSGAGDTSEPTTHTSRTFPSPSYGKSNYVRVSISYNNTAATGENETRYYFVELHRAPKDPIAELEYGNSPYGMIMNDENMDPADKAAAKKAFVDNKYSFGGLDASLVPSVVTDAANAETGNAVIPFNELHYWTEAWVAPDAAYEPESHLGYLYNSTTYEWSPDPNIYKVGNNLDLSDTAFFAILGEAFKDPGLHGVLDSTGRPGRVKDAVLSLQVYALDTDAATQRERFDLPADPNNASLPQTDKDALAARTVTLSRNIAAGSTITDWSALTNTRNEMYPDGAYLRPGRYQLVYTLPDYDYDDYMATDPADRDPNHDPTLKVTRDFVVLAPVGDINANVQDGAGNVSDKTDERLVKGRITNPLGYMAPHYSYDGAIFKLRTCDVNNDRNINNIDADTIRANKCVERYYLPVNYKK